MRTVFDPLRLSAVALDVLASGRATPDAIAARQQSRLAHLLDAAVRGSRIFRERLQGMPPATPLSALPVLGRAELMARFEDWVTDPQLKLQELRSFTADAKRIGEPYLGKYLVWESSGTSHQPGMFVQDARAMAVYDALEALRRSTLRPLQRLFDPLLLAERIAFVGATTGHFASMVSMQRLRQLNPFMAQSLRCFSILQSNSALLDELNAFAPTVIATYPTVAALLADQAAQGALHFLPREIWTGGETLSRAVRRHLEQTLGCVVRNSYGASEFMSIGWECGHGQMHANTDWVILEPIDAQGQPVPDGKASHSTLLTNLANFVQPLIRYDLGDQITLHPERCECGSSLPVIEVQGRRDDPLLMAGQNGRQVTLLPLALTTVLEDEAGVFDFQLRQQDDHTLVLRLDLQGADATAAAARCVNALEQFAVAQGLARLRVLTELGQPVPRGRSGKAQRVVAQRQGKHR
ncbi:MAG: phenylacetate--CoA ligase family protein [Rhodoferax sp.]|uniref:AMP-binding protein n=1 Tax=Rhodoferax sp. TaxID=50421 RepID=UPI0013FF9C55|nr:AMP-binding protein [Rhodoferax sp.]NDP38050.1 phenylacetate--CoA ligase family protein [Rhodoferax sp.]